VSRGRHVLSFSETIIMSERKESLANRVRTLIVDARNTYHDVDVDGDIEDAFDDNETISEYLEKFKPNIKGTWRIHIYLEDDGTGVSIGFENFDYGKDNETGQRTIPFDKLPMKILAEMEREIVDIIEYHKKEHCEIPPKNEE